MLHCLPNANHKDQQDACNSCDCEHSDGCSKGYEYWHTKQDDSIDTVASESYYDDEPSDNMTDVEADADTLASAGMGTDEDYNGFDYGLFEGE